VKSGGASSVSKQIDLFWPEKIIGHHAPKKIVLQQLSDQRKKLYEWSTKVRLQMVQALRSD